jgi:hypothetical protein
VKIFKYKDGQKAKLKNKRVVVVHRKDGKGVMLHFSKKNVLEDGIHCQSVVLRGVRHTTMAITYDALEALCYIGIDVLKEQLRTN